VGNLFPNLSEETISEMLRRIGVKGIESLYADIPPEAFCRKEIEIPGAMSESELEHFIFERLEKNKGYPEYLCFLGGGLGLHYMPAIVDSIVSRSEFLTAYTPYQAEASQGVMQVLFEYQSLIAELTKMGVVNSSMYDWSTGAAEAIRMSFRVTGRRKVVIPETVGRERLDVIDTYMNCIGGRIVTVGYDEVSGATPAEKILNEVDSETASVYIENPNFFGIFEECVLEISDDVHKRGALFVVGVDPISLALVKPPGEYGADIVVGEGQNLGSRPNFGGPSLGIFAVREDLLLIRQMPGRIIGITTEIESPRKAFAMVMQTREQHIRREHATSNICTNEALCAVAAAAYLAYLGPDGLREVALKIVENSHYLARKLGCVRGVDSPVFKGSFFQDFVAKIGPLSAELFLSKLLREHKIIGGLPLTGYPRLRNCLLLGVSEVYSKRDLDRYVHAAQEVLGAHV